jgi:hypothetical protein
MNNDGAREYVVDRNYDSYSSFFDHAWAKSMFDEAGESEFVAMVFNLTEGWKGAANTARLPWLVVNTLAHFANGYANNRPADIELLIEAMIAWFERSVGYSLNLEQQNQMRIAANRWRTDLDEKKSMNPYQLDQHDTWRQMLEQGEFRIGVVASLRITYAAVYYYYEDFVLSCYKYLCAKRNFRIRKSFMEDLSKIYTQDVAREVWQHNEVRLARLARHAIVHNGARETDDLKRFGNPIGVVDGILQITPSVFRVTFSSLKGRALLLLRESVARRR